jgi:hypothetical protein
MSTTSKRISQLPLYTNTQFNPAWMSCVIPANFNSLDNAEYPDTFKVSLSSVVMSLQDVSLNGQLTVLKTLSASCPVLIGDTRNKTGIFIYRGISNTSTTFTNLASDLNSQQYLTIGVNRSWFFKIFVIGVNSSNLSTNIEFIGLLKRNSSGNVSLVGTPTKIIHSRDDIQSDSEIFANNGIEKTIDIRVKGSGYSWTARMDIVQV